MRVWKTRNEVARFKTRNPLKGFGSRLYDLRLRVQGAGFRGWDWGVTVQG